jgi:hypothetical protein
MGNEPNGKLYQLCGPEKAIAISAERTQRQAVPILKPREWLAQFLPNEPNGKLCRFCRPEKHTRNFCETNPPATCNGFEDSKIDRGFRELNERSQLPNRRRTAT